MILIIVPIILFDCWIMELWT